MRHDRFWGLDPAPGLGAVLALAIGTAETDVASTSL